MKQLKYAIVLATAMFATMTRAHATPVFYSDITSESPSKQYKVEAKSPENAPDNKDKFVCFQENFVYTCTDMNTKTLLWTRNQAEGSPRAIFVSDTGWTVISTSGNQIISVDTNGVDHAKVSLLAGYSRGINYGVGVFTEEDMEHVHSTTAGPMWESNSLWYFLDVDDLQLFVIRTWWGRRVIIDIKVGNLVEETPAITKAITESERNYVVTELTRGLETRKLWELDGCGNPNSSGTVWPVLKAAYLAGCLQVKEAIPMLELLQDARYVGGSSMSMGDLGGMLDQVDKTEKKKQVGRISPSSYSTFDVRQVVHIALRRLEKAPMQFPATIFSVHYDDYTQNHPYQSKTLTVPRLNNVDKIKIDMKPNEVLDLLGAPDFVGFQGWEYDMDAVEPFTLVLKWERKSKCPEDLDWGNEESMKIYMVWQNESPVVSDIQKKTPPHWEIGSTRDYFMN